MKKLFYILLFFVTTTIDLSTPVVAEHWSYVGDSDDNVRLLVNTDAFQHQIQDGDVRIMGKFSMYGNHTKFLDAAIYKKWCDQGEGPISLIEMDLNNKPIGVPLNLFYSFKGEKIYDTIGRSLCQYYSTFEDEPPTYPDFVPEKPNIIDGSPATQSTPRQGMAGSPSGPAAN